MKTLSMIVLINVNFIVRVFFEPSTHHYLYVMYFRVFTAAIICVFFYSYRHLFCVVLHNSGYHQVENSFPGRKNRGNDEGRMGEREKGRNDAVIEGNGTSSFRANKCFPFIYPEATQLRRSCSDTGRMVILLEIV